jgi:cell division protein ZipA
MELNLRTVLVILGALVMLGILIDGFRRMRRARLEALKLDVKGDFKFPEESFSSELPNGGARVIGERDAEELLEDVKIFRDQLDDLPGLSALDQMEDRAEHDLAADIQESLHEERIYAGEPDFQHDSYHLNESQVDEPLTGDNVEQVHERVIPKAKPLNLDENVPLLMDVEELGEDLAAQPVAASIEESLEKIEETVGEVGVEPAPSSDEHIEITLDDVEGIKASVADIGDLMSVQQSEVAAPSARPKQTPIIDEEGRQQAQEMMAQAAYVPVKKPGPNAELLSTRSAPGLVVVTHVVPHEEAGFCGEDILYLVNSCDLRHGEKDIFHRFELEDGEGNVQFSMANSFNPGTFDPETLLHERIYGVSLFMSLPGPKKAMDAFEAMTEMASVIARNLGGDVHDETHSIMALQTIEHNRQQVRDFVRKQKLAGKK